LSVSAENHDPLIQTSLTHKQFITKIDVEAAPKMFNWAKTVLMKLSAKQENIVLRTRPTNGAGRLQGYGWQHENVFVEGLCCELLLLFSIFAFGFLSFEFD
jgi:hypothetical protein